MTSDDLLYYDKTVIRRVTEYAYAVWHSIKIITVEVEQQDHVVGGDRRVVRIIFGNELDYDTLNVIYGVPVLVDRL